LDPGAGPVQRFAFELRKLRQEAGGITYRAMARGTDYSVTTLSRAAAGEQLPSLPVTLAYVAACGGDGEEWERRWREVDEEATVAAVAADDSDPPYQGLARFEPGDRERFFGRERLAGEVLALVRARRFSAVFGPSGSGKSSLLRAGLIPALQSEPSARLRPAAIRILSPGPHPARTHTALFTPKDGPGDTVVVIDQFEEVFTLCTDPAERKAFIDLALTALQPETRLRVVLAVRADFYGRCAEHDALAQALGATSLLVGPMNPAELREAVVKPAMASGLIVEKALTARIVEEVTDEPGGLPLMSHALLETWRRRKGRALGEAAYEAAGGIHGAIARTAEDVYTQLTPAQADIARRILLRLITPGDGTQDTRRPADRAELDTDQSNDTTVVLERLVRARLVTLDDNTVDLAHEALITAWPRLRSWIDEDRERLRAHRKLTEAAMAWNDLSRDPGALYRGTRLGAAEELFAAPARAGAEDLTDLERSFLTASSAGRTRERRRLRGLVTTLSLLLGLAVLAAVVAVQQNRTNDRQHTQAEARRIAAVADSMRFSDPVKAMQLSVAAWRLAHTTETRSALLGAMTQKEEDVFTPPDGDSGAAAGYDLTEDGRTLMSIGDGRIDTWDVRSHRQTGSYKGLGKDVSYDRAAASPDGRTFAMTTDNGVRLWDIAAGHQIGGALGDASASAGFSPSGRILMNFGYGDALQLWDVKSRRLLLTHHWSGGTGLQGEVISPDDQWLAVCDGGRPLEIWNVAEQRKLSTPWISKAGKDNCFDGRFEFTPDSRKMAVATNSGIRTWDIHSGKEMPQLKDASINDMRFSDDGKFVAATDDNQILLWRLAAPDTPVFSYAPVNDTPNDLRLDLAANVIRYLSGAGSTVVTLNLAGSTTPRWQDHEVDSATFSADSRTLATVHRSGDGAGFQLLDAQTGRIVSDLPGKPCGPLPTVVQDSGLAETRGGACAELMSFSAGGRFFAYGKADEESDGGGKQRITVWDVAARRKRTVLELPESVEYAPSTTGIALSADGGTLFVSRQLARSTVEAWDVRRRIRTKTLAGASGEQGQGQLLLRADDSLLMSDDGTVVDLRSGKVTHGAFFNADDPSEVLALNRSWKYLAVGDQFGRIALWDGASGHKRLGILSSVSTSAGARSRGIDDATAITVSPDGSTLAAASSDGAIQLWDVASHQLLGSALPTPGDPLLSLGFSPDGGTLYAAGTHVPLQRYEIGSPGVAADVCERAGTGLSRADWKTYLSGIPYRKTC
jgi:WD40 repeat protein